MNIAVFTGAGISADSGIKTFRDHDGLWERHRIEDVATPEAFARNPALVLEFYNMRYKQLQDVKPNAAHEAIAHLQKQYKVHVVTQNVDDLHERAGSLHVLHLHGELNKCRSIVDDTAIYPMPSGGLRLGDRGPDGHQLRPHIVWFGEMVPKLEEAAQIVRGADLLLVVGSSLQVYPAAGLVYETKQGTPIYLIDPADQPYLRDLQLTHLRERAVTGVPKIIKELFG